ncbi:MAG: hypothetical protein ACR2QO_22260 [Acidimicrobiales bacterium]
MTDKTLSKARGLNSIADPRSFKGASGRRRGAAEQPPEPPPAPAVPPADQSEPIPVPAPVQPSQAPMPPPAPTALHPAPVAQPPVAPLDVAPVSPAPQPLRSDSHHGATPAVSSQALQPQPHPQAADPQLHAAEQRTPHRAVNPGINRKRRELSVPHVLADALERTGINPADVVMAAYRKHSHAIYAGEGGRMTAKGRTRLRLSISDDEFEQLTRLGQARGWNRSETVSVILTMELLGPAATPPLAGGAG